MRIRLALLAAVLSIVPAWSAAQVKPKPKPKVSPLVLQLQAQVQTLTAERDDLKARLAAAANLQQDLAAAQQSRDLARQEADSTRKELDDMKASLAENQGSSDAILAELQKTKAELADALAAKESTRAALEASKQKQEVAAAGQPVAITPDITPARPLNLNKITPDVRKVGRGVVVVNVLVGENGDALDTRLLQGLPGDGEWVTKANQACVEAAKRLVCDPARAADGKTRVRVWQGVGIMLD
jgi:seryl-tRNA synthetase